MKSVFQLILDMMKMKMMRISSEDLIGKKLKIHLGDLDLMTWKVDLEGDHQLILGLLRSIKVIDAAHDAKLQHLKQQVIEKVQQPINPSNYKVIIFTAFADTAHYIYEHLAPYLHEQHQLHSACITGSKTIQPLKQC
jgi:hypothetical protein